MPFEVTDNQTGKIITFVKKPTEQDLQEAFGATQQTKNEPENLGVMPFVNKGIARTVGAPVDLATAGLKAVGLDIPQPFGGSQSIERGMQNIGIPIPGQEAETLPETIGAGIGEATGALLPMGAGVKLISKGTGLASNIAKTIFETMRKHPSASLISEVTGGAGMGTGRYAAKDIESPAGKIAAEMVGGAIGGLAPSATAFTPTRLGIAGTKKIAQKVSLPFSEAGAKYRAGEFIKKQVASPEETAKLVGEKTIGELPIVVATGEKRLIALYNRLRSLDPVKDAQEIENLSRSAFKLEQEMRAFGSGSPETLRGITEKRIAALELGMDDRTARAMDLAQKKLDSLPIAQRKAEESIIVRNELVKTMKQEKQLVDDIWEQVPRNAIVKTENTKNIYNNLIDDLATAQQGDVPLVLRNSPILQEGVGLTSVKEMQGLRSKLGEVSRQARANNQWNRARIADDVSDAILLDLGASAKSATKTPEGEALSAAIAATKQFKNRFEQGITGKILGYEKSSAPSISPELTLDISVGRMKERGAVDINKVAVTQEAKDATERYLTRSFTDYSLDKTGVINPIKAEKWVKNNEAILDNFPNLRTKLTDASESQKLASTTKTLMDARKAKLRDPNISASGKFLKTNIGEEVKTVFKSSNPANFTNQLVRMARQDQTGKALDGVKAGFVEHILARSAIGGYNELGEQTLSGRTMLDFMNKNINTLRQVFSQEQLLRMRKIGNELAKVEMVEKIKGEGIEYNDIVSNLIHFGSRVGGAAIGRHWGKGLGAAGNIQIPGFFAAQYLKVAKYLTKNRFENLINDAILSKDPKLLEALLMPINKPTTPKGINNLKIIDLRLNAWSMGSGVRVFKDINEEDNFNSNKEVKQ